MRRQLRALLLPALAACVTNPLTGRNQLLLIGVEEEFALGARGYQQQLAKETVSGDPAEVEPVLRVGRRVAAAAEEYIRERRGKMFFEWEFSVIKNDRTVNAFCLPGGKVAVYTGIFPACYDEDGLAAVIGHEIAHALGRHGAERISQSALTELGGALLAAALSRESEKTISGALQAYGVVSQVGVLLPFSRDHESEADALGLILAARAGYDPRAAVKVWQRMGLIAPHTTPEFLSTHPSHETRIANLEARMPGALKIFENAERAPSAPLPALGRPVRAAPAAAVEFRAGPARRDRKQNGAHGLLFHFTPAEHLYLKRAHIGGPFGIEVSIDAGVTLAARQERFAGIFRPNPADPPLPGGRYALALEGLASGRPFRHSIVFHVP